MNKYNGLLLSIGQKYHICKGTQETENEWKVRLIYSICGMMAYASLWDDEEDEPISIVHLKRKVRIMFANYKSMYKEIPSNLMPSSAELEDEISSLFLNTGVVYHRPNRIAPSMRRDEPYGDIIFQRGIALDNISCVSGIGFYAMREGTSGSGAVNSMFGLEYEPLRTLWLATLSSASWSAERRLEQNTEFLRLTPPFSSGYWVNKPDTTGTVSILRSGMEGSQIYFLYRYSNAGMEVSPLPQWQVESYMYRSLACACLLAYGTLPPIEYYDDGALIHICMNYLLPPPELEFLKLYSWPESCTSRSCNFRRKLSKEVFISIRNVLSDEGYVFKGGKA